MTELRNKLALACIGMVSAFVASQPLSLQAQTTARSAVSASHAVPARVTQKVVNSQRATLAGHIRPFLNRAVDQGALSDTTSSKPMMLIFSRTAQQQADLDALADAQHNQNSPQFKQWLTPQQFGERFSPADSDIAAVRTWMESQGLKVLDLPPSKTFISFTGTVGQLKNAFGVNIHKVSIDGAAHVANVNEPTVPAALATVIGGIRGLDDFGGKPMMQKRGAMSVDLKTGKATPIGASGPKAAFSDSSGGYQVGPQDFYTIYNETPLLNAGITGAGQTVAVIEEATISPDDVNTFRSVFGLPAYPSTPNGTDGGLNMLTGSNSGLNGYASCYAPATLAAGKSSGEEGEAALDAQWAGAVAPKATVDFVACGGTLTNPDGTTLGATGIDHSAQYIVNYLQGTVVAASMSYGECEAQMSSSATSGVGYYNNQWQQFAVEGITPIVSSGDAGSAQCYQNRSYATTLPPSVNGMGSSAWNVSAGGTDFGDAYITKNYTTAPASTWWNASNGTGLGSAVSYVPETTWSGYCSNPLFVSYLQSVGSTTFGTVYNPIAVCSSSYSTANGYTAVVGGAGGISTYNTIPSWQNVYGIGANSVSSTNRNIPDVSLFAANGFWGHILPYCESDEYACTLANYNAEDLVSGGTSFVAPQLAGLMALVAQKTGQAQGQADYTIYKLAAQQYGTSGSPSSTLAACSGSALLPGQTPPASCIFHDISNDTPSLQGGTIASSIAQPCRRTSSTYCDGIIGTTSYTYGITTVPGTTATNGVFAYLAGPGYDDATGLGSFNISNLVNGWNSVGTGFASTTSLKSSVTAIVARASQSATFTATVIASGRSNALPAGTVTFYVGSTSGTNLGTVNVTGACTGTNASTSCSGTAALTLTGDKLPVGNDNIIAYFNGDGANDAPSTSGSVAVAVTAQPTATVAVQPQQFTPGAASTTLSATVTFSGPQPTGAVAFLVDNANSLNAACSAAGASTLNCTVDYPTSALTATSHTLTVAQLGDAQYDTATGSAALTPGSSKPTVQINVVSQTIPVGQASTTITVNATFTSGVFPTGTSVVVIDNAQSANAACSVTSYSSATCSATLPTGSLTPGSHTITGVSKGDANYQTGYGYGTLTVSPTL